MPLERCEVLIVGAGLAGTSLAWHLAGSRGVLCLEQGEQPCAEASSQNAGMVRRLVPGDLERDEACRSYERLVKLTSGEDWAESPPFRVTGSVIGLAEGPNPALEAAARDLAARGVPVEEVAGERLAAVAPALAGAPLHRAWFLADEGTCDSWSLSQGFVRGAARRGAEFRYGVRVEQLLTDGGRVVGVRSDQGEIRADLVVLANGAWARGLAQGSRIERPFTPLARHLFSSAPHPLSSRDHPWCWLDDAGIYVRPEAGGFLCSPCDEAERDPSAGPGSAGAIDSYWRAVAQDKLAQHMPALSDLRLPGGWTGLRTFAPDRRAVVGLDPEVEGLAWLAGLGGFGVTCAMTLGQRGAEAIVAGNRASFPPAGSKLV